MKKEYTLPVGFTVTAHTGCMGTKANSLESITAGAQNGANTVEFDLNFNIDNNPVLSHDSPVGGEITLDEAFAKVAEYDNLLVNVDLKSTVAIEKIVPLAKKHNILERIFFTGVDESFVKAVKTRTPEVDYYLNMSVLPEKQQTEEYLLSLVNKVKECGAVGINFHKDNATTALVDVFHNNGLLVSIWTVDEEEEMYRILSLSPDNITTRYPNVLANIIKD